MMKTATATLNCDKAEMAFLSLVIEAAMKELARICNANKAAHAEIRRLRASTHQKLRRSERNLRHVEAVC